MAIKIKNVDSRSVLAKEIIHFGPTTSASGISSAKVYPIVVPIACKLDNVTFMTETGISGDSPVLIHVLVTNQTTSQVPLDYSITGTTAVVNAITANSVLQAVPAASADFPITANSVLSVMISACEVAGEISGYLQFTVNKTVD